MLLFYVFIPVEITIGSYFFITRISGKHEFAGKLTGGVIVQHTTSVVYRIQLIYQAHFGLLFILIV